MVKQTTKPTRTQTPAPIQTPAPLADIRQQSIPAFTPVSGRISTGGGTRRLQTIDPRIAERQQEQRLQQIAKEQAAREAADRSRIQREQARQERIESG